MQSTLSLVPGFSASAFDPLFADRGVVGEDPVTTVAVALLKLSLGIHCPYVCLDPHICHFLHRLVQRQTTIQTRPINWVSCV